MPSKASDKKAIYLANNLGELQKMSELNKAQGSTNPRILVKSADKVFQEAEKFDVQGDEERAFIMYMKYFNIVKVIKAHQEYKKSKDYYDQMIGNKNQGVAIDKAEKLADSLKQRYELIEAEAVAQKFAALNTGSKAPEKDVSADKKQKENSEISNGGSGGVSSLNGETSSLGTAVEERTPPRSITPMSLYELLCDSTVQLILMDARPTAEFKESHINHHVCISVPQEVLHPGTTVPRIESLLPEESKSLWQQRGKVDHIVLLDWDSQLNSITVGTTLKTLKDALFMFDSTVILKEEPLILEGGYEQWLLFYPTMTTNAKVSRPHMTQPLSSFASLDFDYPDFDLTLESNENRDDSMIDAQAHSSVDAESRGVSGSLPSFNRALKPRTVTEHLADSLAKPTQDLNNTRNLNTDREARSEGISKLSNPLYPSIPADTKAASAMKPEKNTNIFNEQQKATSNLGRVRSDVEIASPSSSTQALHPAAGNQAYISRKEEEEIAKLKELEQMRKQQERELADLMRKKRHVEQEMKENEKKAAQQKELQLAIDKASKEKEDMERRMAEVEHLRSERKRLEEQAEKERQEKKAHKRANREAQERARQEEEEKEILRKKKEELMKGEERVQLEASAAAASEKIRLEAEMAQRHTEKQEAEMKLKAEHEKKIRLEEKKREQEKAEMKSKAEHEKIWLEEKKREQEKAKEEEKKREEVEKSRKAKEMRKEPETKTKEMIDLIYKEEAQKLADMKRAEEERKLAIPNQQNTIRQAQAPKMIPSTTLPKGWEKRLDHSTNRYYYIDHNHGKTQWEPPVVQTNTKVDVQKAKLKGEPPRSNMSRSYSSPDIMKQVTSEQESSTQLPVFERSSKPSLRPQEPRPFVRQVTRRRDLNPVFGNVGPALTGLRNLGNTCYMNSTIQCLNNTTPLVSYFLNDIYLEFVNRDSEQGMHGEVVDEFAVVIKALWCGQYRCITPRDLKATIGKYNPMFAGYQQQDSQEFLTFLLDGLHEGMNEIKVRPHISDQDNDSLPDPEAAKIAWDNHKRLHSSIIVELFQGQLKSTLMCRHCKKKSVTFQAFMYISLPIPANSRCTLRDCLRAFLQPERMTGSCKWKCPSCKTERDAEKKIDIWKLPPILLIGLNRFVNDGMWMQKITTYVDFPVDDLDMGEFIIGPKPRSRYNLYGISNHYGTMEGGHYTAFCRNPCSSKWYKFDDHEVYEMSKSDVKTSAAFVLYYTAIELNAPHFKPQL